MQAIVAFTMQKTSSKSFASALQDLGHRSRSCMLFPSSGSPLLAFPPKHGRFGGNRPLSLYTTNGNDCPARAMKVNICGKGVRSPASSIRSFLALKQFLKDAASGKIWTQSLTFSRRKIESYSSKIETTSKISWRFRGFETCKAAH